MGGDEAVIYKLRLGPLVLSDAENARVWYERRVSGLGARFESEFYAALDEITAHPLLCPPFQPAAQSGIRHQLLASFPYALYFYVEDGEIRVVLFFHGARNPLALRRELKRRIF